MVITETEMYWLTRLDYLHTIALAVGISITTLSGIWLIVSSICHTINISESANGRKASIEQLPVSRKSVRWSIPCFLLSWGLIIGACFIPTTKEMCAIKAIPMIVNNKQVQELPSNALELANEWLDELRPSKKK